ncbi:hypothetical protein [Scandinavium lactucae]|uniref:Uncharacterized protein n=1 Tax=Scandinavium lactucae TaxID=3095028 RepID=A0ABU4QQF6_9ENTR|nr:MULTISPECIES: hypothetical protein [unclassified Scandinavium]MDX6040584.1 hypothetical protein [Scandinavium sp. V105_6]MDX6048713.1 hypothetical protein [Scandinavium sp. V105_1]
MSEKLKPFALKYLHIFRHEMECRENVQHESLKGFYGSIFSYRSVLCLEKKTHNPKISRYVAALAVLLMPESRIRWELKNKKAAIRRPISILLVQQYRGLEAQIAEHCDDFMKAFHFDSCIAH